VLKIFKKRGGDPVTDARGILPVSFNYFELKAIHEVFKQASKLSDIAMHDRLIISEINYKLNKAGFYK
jgi:hypothetical protein